jgi:hypothetical protein
VIRGAARIVCLVAAFWTALALYRGDRPLRFVGALAAGAALTHLGWAALYWPIVRDYPRSILDPEAGQSVLFLPLGLLLLARDPAAWRVLPIALAVARLGCVAAGCCRGVPAPWGVHPIALYEVSLLVGLHVALRRLGARWVAPSFLLAFGLARLATDSLRAMPPLGPPAVAPSLLAGLWVLGGVGWGVWQGEIVVRAAIAGWLR